MRIAKTLLAASLFLLPGKAYSAGRFNTVDLGNIIMQMSDGRDFLQTGPFTIEFRVGEMFVELRDGYVTIAACFGNGGPIALAPQIGCPLGTTAFISSGDFNGDGVRDDLSFWSVAEVAPAIIVEPFLPGVPELQSAPQSDLPRPLGPFNDRGVLVFYNILTATIRQFDITFYDFVRSYGAGLGEWNRMDDEVVPGQYNYAFPLLNDPDVSIPLGVILYQPPKVFKDGEAVDSDRYFRFVSGVWSDDGYYLMDARFTSQIRWIGMRLSNTIPLLDEYTLAIYNYDEDDPVNSETQILFPPNGERVTLEITDVLEETGPGFEHPALDHPIAAGGYNLPPFFFLPGQEILFQLRLDRLIPTTVATYDTSCRLLNFRGRFVDTYAGFILVAFPTGSELAERAPGEDFDGDGWTNLEEFAFGQQTEVYEIDVDPDTLETTFTLTEIIFAPDPADPASTPDTEGTYPTVEADGSKVLITLTKRAFTEGVIDYTLNASIMGDPAEDVTMSAAWEIVEDSQSAFAPGALPGDPPTKVPGVLQVRSVADLAPGDVTIDVDLSLRTFRN